MKQIAQMNVYKIGVSQREANEYLFPLSDGDIEEVGHYLKVIKFGDIEIAILIESYSYYSHFIVYTDDFSGVNLNIGIFTRRENAALPKGIPIAVS